MQEQLGTSEPQENAIKVAKNFVYFVLCLFLKEEICDAVKKMLENFGTQRHIANLGHGMHPDHEPEKLATFIDTVHSYSEKMNALNAD